MGALEWFRILLYLIQYSWTSTIYTLRIWLINWAVWQQLESSWINIVICVKRVLNWLCECLRKQLIIGKSSCMIQVSLPCPTSLFFPLGIQSQTYFILPNIFAHTKKGTWRESPYPHGLPAHESSIFFLPFTHNPHPTHSVCCLTFFFEAPL